jgi:hypothetical protein
MKGMADTEPERLIIGCVLSHYNYNINEVEVEDIEGNPRTVYEYDYVVIEGTVTKAKIIRALENSKLDIDEEYDPAEIETNYNDAKSAIALSDIAGMTYAELDTYIDNHVTNLAEAKTYLKKLSKVVLAMLKYLDV